MILIVILIKEYGPAITEATPGTVLQRTKPQPVAAAWVPSSDWDTCEPH